MSERVKLVLSPMQTAQVRALLDAAYFGAASSGVVFGQLELSTARDEEELGTTPEDRRAILTAGIVSRAAALKIVEVLADDNARRQEKAAKKGGK